MLLGRRVAPQVLSRAGRTQLRSFVSQKEPYETVTLSNGARIITNPLPSHFSCLGVYINAGSRYEPEALVGTSHLIDRLAFKTTAFSSDMDIKSALESLGGNYMCASSRESLMYQGSVFNEGVEEMFKHFADTITSPLLLDEEIEEQVNIAYYEISEINKKPEVILPEIFHSTAFSNKTLGSPLLCPVENLPNINHNLLYNYRSLFFKPENTVFSFIGVDTDNALKLVEKYYSNNLENKGNFESSNMGLQVNKDYAHYTGGETSLPSIPNPASPQKFSYLHIGFEGLSIDDPDIYAAAILQTLLGGGGSFSAGGPGKGMYSRLYTQVLNQYGYIDNCVAFNHSYIDSGLFGISASCLENAEPYLVEIVCRELAHTFEDGKQGLKPKEFQRAKNQLKSSLLMNLESKMVELEDIGRQVQILGKKTPLFDIIGKIEAVSLQDVKNVAKRILTGNAQNKGNGTGRPTIVLQGNREAFDDVEGTCKRYGLGRFTPSESTKEPKKKWFF
ncbi:mitochondrial-processing protease subunit alpha [Ascoidea rubescens DSM 1968]|uniref:Alpha-MPP n=1 Tax=Ascoidea rubescens DSM 1968 TaxID=1344418 RepID=A0A1D2VCA2_9ASCO|nr:mitochondrial processing protease 53 kDa subunit [Ascoidea rubescens DSM 1968]ODV59256.1 mitochondrial processing protease 53 kDa subunit [Ascoidea rubescens DSM 1968]